MKLGLGLTPGDPTAAFKQLPKPSHALMLPSFWATEAPLLLVSCK